MINLSRKPVAQFTPKTEERAGPLIRRVCACPVLTMHFAASAWVLPDQAFPDVNGGNIGTMQRLKKRGN
jgi:hypothetical protein